MRLMAAALAGRITDPAAMVRLFGLFLLATFTVELAVMVLLPWIVSPAVLPVSRPRSGLV
jgi:hypothetical protein